MRSDLLSFAVPTYNRAEILEDTLTRLANRTFDYGIPIFVSDNASTDNTEEIVRKLQERYPQIQYTKQKANLGLDGNFAAALSFARGTKYVWLFGDAVQTEEGGFESVHRILSSSEKPLDLLVVNAVGRVHDKPSCSYFSLKEFLEDIGWHMTLMSSMIFNADIIAHARFEKYMGTNFLHNGIAIEYLASKNPHIVWIDRPVVKGTHLIKTNSWTSRSMEVFGKNWSEFVLSLPESIDAATKRKVIYNHSKYTGFFSLPHLLRLKSNGWLTKEQCIRIKPYWPLVSRLPWWGMQMVRCMPDFVFTRGGLIYKLFRPLFDS